MKQSKSKEAAKFHSARKREKEEKEVDYLTKKNYHERSWMNWIYLPRPKRLIASEKEEPSARKIELDFWSSRCFVWLYEGRKAKLKKKKKREEVKTLTFVFLHDFPSNFGESKNMALLLFPAIFSFFLFSLLNSTTALSMIKQIWLGWLNLNVYFSPKLLFFFYIYKLNIV